ncbi:MAG TPA: hypothetical protein VN450_08435 [Candidatus Methylomirabilis sp.]|nr:hypothetical protein [Candidatus Methylomirabilis sp.]
MARPVQHPQKTRIGWAVLGVLPMLLSGCWYSLSISIVSGVGTDPFTISSASDPALDGDVRDDGAVVTSGAIFAGFDPAAPVPRPEYRGFLSFDIEPVPPGALVEWATVTLTADRVDLLPGSAEAILEFDSVDYDGRLSSPAFGAPGTPVRSTAAGVRVAGARAVAIDVTPEVQAAADQGRTRFQLRVLCSGGLASLVDGAGGRPGGVPPDPALAPVLTVRYR